MAFSELWQLCTCLCAGVYMQQQHKEMFPRKSSFNDFCVLCCYPLPLKLLIILTSEKVPRGSVMPLILAVYQIHYMCFHV